MLRLVCVSALAALDPAGLSIETVLAQEASSAIPDPSPDPSIAASLAPEPADPGGVRTALARRGVSYGLNYTGDVLGNVTGGVRRSTHYAGLLEAYVDADLGTLAGLSGLTFHASGYQIHGTSISADNLGSLTAASNVEAYPSTRLFELWLEQAVLGGALSLRLGQIAADDEFFAADGGGGFLNSTFGWTAISSDNIPVGGPIYPIATPGARVRFAPNEALTLMAGVWNGDPVGPCAEDLDPGQCNRHGLDFRLGDSPLMVVEGAYAYGKGQGALPGTIKLGGWRHFGHFHDLSRDAAGGPLGSTGGDPLLHDANHGFYAVLDQMVYRAPGNGETDGISMFARLAASPSDRNQVDVYLDAGVVFSGFIPGRPRDVFGIALAHAGLSDDAAAFDRDSGALIVREHETVLEVTYIAEIVPGFTIQPDFQYFWNPGGRVPDPRDLHSPVPDAAVLGVRSTINY